MFFQHNPWFINSKTGMLQIALFDIDRRGNALSGLYGGWEIETNYVGEPNVGELPKGEEGRKDMKRLYDQKRSLVEQAIRASRADSSVAMSAFPESNAKKLLGLYWSAATEAQRNAVDGVFQKQCMAEFVKPSRKL